LAFTLWACIKSGKKAKRSNNLFMVKFFWEYNLSFADNISRKA